MKLKYTALAIGIVVICAAVGPFMAASTGGGQTREFLIQAKRYAFEPGRIFVNRGDTVKIRLISLDVVHGFFLEGHDINAIIEPGTPIGKKLPLFRLRHPSQGTEYKLVEEIVFTANRPGKFRYRCSHGCGTMHPFMQGEMIVSPNYPYLAAMGGVVGIVIAAFGIWFLRARAGEREPQTVSATDA